MPKIDFYDTIQKIKKFINIKKEISEDGHTVTFSGFDIPARSSVDLTTGKITYLDDEAKDGVIDFEETFSDGSIVRGCLIRNGSSADDTETGDVGQYSEKVKIKLFKKDIQVKP